MFAHKNDIENLIGVLLLVCPSDDLDSKLHHICSLLKHNIIYIWI